jgi:hypothetical protein
MRQGTLYARSRSPFPDELTNLTIKYSMQYDIIFVLPSLVEFK